MKETIEIPTFYDVDKGFNPIANDNEGHYFDTISLYSLKHIRYWKKNDGTDVTVTITQNKETIKEMEEEWTLFKNKESFLKSIEPDFLYGKLDSYDKFEQKLSEKLKEKTKKNLQETRDEMKELKYATNHVDEFKEHKLVVESREIRNRLRLLRRAISFVDNKEQFLFNKDLEIVFDEKGYAKTAMVVSKEFINPSDVFLNFEQFRVRKARLEKGEAPQDSSLQKNNKRKEESNETSHQGKNIHVLFTPPKKTKIETPTTARYQYFNLN